MIAYTETLPLDTVRLFLCGDTDVAPSLAGYPLHRIAWVGIGGEDSPVRMLPYALVVEDPSDPAIEEFVKQYEERPEIWALVTQSSCAG